MSNAATMESLPALDEVGRLGVCHLRRLWARVRAPRQGRAGGPADPHHDHLVIDALGLGLEQTMAYLGNNDCTFDEFERWIVATAGETDPQQIARVNAALTGSAPPPEVGAWLNDIDSAEPVLSADDLAFWDEHGYVVLHDAVAPADRDAAAQAVWDHAGARPDDPQTWYGLRRRSTMLQYFQHPAFAANRRSPRIHKAFAQLWGTADLWVTTDRVGFNVPERPGWGFPGPDLHWDMTLRPPLRLGIQGVLYLTDTPAEQGAFTCVPSFHRRLETWLASLPPGADPRRQNLHALGAQPIAGRAGDLVIWHHALPHGSSPNRGTRPRLVQYIKLYPTPVEEPAGWA
jgi:hypothetical protein